MPGIFSKKLLLAASTIAGLSISGWSFSALPAQAQPAAAPETGGVEEVVVTARRREESAQTVPVSITAISNKQLTQHSFRNMEDLSSLSPGLHFSGEGGAQNEVVTLRGVTKPPIGYNTPGVVLYLNEIPQGPDGSQFPAYDVQSIQVLKGPQGTLFGRNTIGGAILITTVLPNFDGINGYAKVGAGNYGYWQTEGALNIPIIDDVLAVRAAGQINRRSGWVINAAPLTGDQFNPGTNLDDVNNYNGRFSVLFKPTDNLTDTFVADYEVAHESGNASFPYQLNPGTNPGAPGFIPTQFDVVGCNVWAPIFNGIFGTPLCGADPNHPNPYGEAAVNQVQSGALNFNHTWDNNHIANREIWGFSNKTEWNVIEDELTLKNIFGYRRANLLDASNSSGLAPLDPCTVSAAYCGFPFQTPVMNGFEPSDRRNVKQLTEEFQALGSLFDKRLDYIVGVFWAQNAPGGPEGQSGITFTGYEPVLGPPGRGVFGMGSAYIWSNSRAIYGQIGYDMSDWLLEGLKLNLGYRYTWDQNTGCGENTPPLTPPAVYTVDTFLSADTCRADNGITTPGNPFGVQTVVQSHTNAPTWTVGLDWKANDNLFFYITSRRGYRSGGPNTPAFFSPFTTIPTGDPSCDPAIFALYHVHPGNGVCQDVKQFQTFKPEKITDIELGMKSTWEMGDWHGLFNFAFYRSWYDNAEALASMSGAFGFAQAVAGVPIPDQPGFGALTVNGGNVRITGLDLEASVSPTDDLTLSFIGNWQNQHAMTNVVTGVLGFLTFTDPVGWKPLLPSPQYSFTLSGDYTLPFRPYDSPLVFHIDYFWTAKVGVQGSFLPGYDTINTRLDWQDIADSGLDAGLFVRNLADNHYLYTGNIVSPGLGVNTASYAEPRMFGGELTYHFGEK